MSDEIFHLEPREPHDPTKDGLRDPEDPRSQYDDFDEADLKKWDAHAPEEIPENQAPAPEPADVSDFPEGKLSPRRENRIAAMQFLYAWDVSTPRAPSAKENQEQTLAETEALSEYVAKEPVAAEDTRVLVDELCVFFEAQRHPRDFYSFAEGLIDGALKNQSEIDARIESLATNWTIGRIAKVDLALLRLAVHELLHRSDIPPVVSMNEAIELAKHYSAEDSRRFINGILDKVSATLNRPLREAS